MRKLLALQDAPGPRRAVGGGVPVRPMFTPETHGTALSPFILLDYAPPTEFQAAPKKQSAGVQAHRGFELVTIVYAGDVDYRDSKGGTGRIGPGDVQWMTAGAGMLREEFHSAAATKTGGVMEMAQLWVNLPAKEKMSPPSYQALPSDNIDAAELPNGAGRVRVIAGAFAKAKGPARTRTPMNVWDVRLKRGGKTKFELSEGHTLALMIQKGEVLLNGEHAAQGGQLATFALKGGAITLEAKTDAQILLLSGQPINDPMVHYGRFVMNTEAEMRQAVSDFNEGKFGDMAAFT